MKMRIGILGAACIAPAAVITSASDNGEVEVCAVASRDCAPTATAQSFASSLAGTPSRLRHNLFENGTRGLQGPRPESARTTRKSCNLMCPAPPALTASA
jgi:hypothetical protein